MVIRDGSVGCDLGVPAGRLIPRRWRPGHNPNVGPWPGARACLLAAWVVWLLLIFAAAYGITRWLQAVL